MVVNQHQGILKVVLDDFGNTAEMLKEQRRARLDPTGHIVFLKGSSYFRCYKLEQRDFLD